VKYTISGLFSFARYLGNEGKQHVSAFRDIEQRVERGGGGGGSGVSHPPHNTLEGVIEVLLQCLLVDVLEQLLLREDAVKLHRPGAFYTCSAQLVVGHEVARGPKPLLVLSVQKIPGYGRFDGPVRRYRITVTT
jgi:hypothetical protein